MEPGRFEVGGWRVVALDIWRVVTLDAWRVVTLDIWRVVSSIFGA
jgi:hypothetical protein